MNVDSDATDANEEFISASKTAKSSMKLLLERVYFKPHPKGWNQNKNPMQEGHPPKDDIVTIGSDATDNEEFSFASARPPPPTPGSEGPHACSQNLR